MSLDVHVLQFRRDLAVALQRQFAIKGVVWLNIDPGLEHDSPADARKDMIRFKMSITDWIMDDSGQTLCRQCGIRVTPQMFVIDKDGILAYTGAVDGGILPVYRRPELAYLRNAVNELLEDKKVSVPHVKPGGCLVLYPEFGVGAPGTGGARPAPR